MAEPASLLIAYDPALAETASEDGHDDEIAVIVRLADSDTLPAGVRIITRFGNIATVRVRREQLAELAERESVLALEASRRLRLDEGAACRFDGCGLDEPSPLHYLRRPEGVTATGRGVVVAVLDWGVDVAHPAFRRDDGATRLVALWDQRGGRGSGAGNRWGYGRILSAEAIDRALREPDPYRALDYHPADSDERDADSGEWKGAHGTHVLDIAAGNGRGGGMAGVAPDADLVFVHLSRTTPALGRGNLGDSATVLEALDFVFEIAGERPCVVNMSVGAHGGPHDGTTLVEQGIDQAVWLEAGRAVVNSAGNYFAAGAHAYGRLKQGDEDELRFHVPAGDPTASELEIYYESTDLLTATVIDPAGNTVASLAPGQDAPLVVLDKVAGHAYHYIREAINGDRHIDLFLKPNAPPGLWTIRLKGDAIRDGRYHAWIERDRGLRPTFVRSAVDENSTTGTLCNGRYSISVGAFDPHRDEWPLGAFSSAGPTRDGRIKPEVVAPGVDISAARSTPPLESPDARYTSKGGTSMAAPHVTGTIAIMFEAAGRPLEISDTRALLFSSTDCPPRAPGARRASDLHRRGFGYVNVATAENAAREWGSRRRAAGNEDALVAAESTERDSPPADPITQPSCEEAMNPAFDEHAITQDPFANDTGEDIIVEAPDSELAATHEPTPSGGYEETVSVDDVAIEMNGLRCRFVRAFTAERSDGARLGFSAGALHPIENWNGTATEATVAGFRVHKVFLAPQPDSVRNVRLYQVALDAQRTAISENARQLREWLAQEASYRANRSAWEREKRRLEDLLSRRQVVYSRLWVRQMMYNRFDVAIAHWTRHYNGQLGPHPELEPNIVKSMLYQESRMGTSGAHLMPPPSDWSSSDRHPIRSRFNIGQAIDSWGPQQWLMMREMAPLIFARHGLDAFAAGRRWFGMTNDEYAAHAPFVRAMREFFEHRVGTRNLMGTDNRDLHEDYGFWIRTAIRWLFVKFSNLRHPGWAEAVRTYNGSGPRAERYRDAVMARAGSLEPFTESLGHPASHPEEIFAPVRAPLHDEERPLETAAAEDRTPRLDRSAGLEWEDLARVPDSRGQQQVFYVLTGAPPGIARAGEEGHAVFHLRVRNTNSVYNHQNVTTKYRVLDVLPGRQFREVLPWRSFGGPALEDESSRVIRIALGSTTLSSAYNPDSPLTRLEVEYHWREQGEDFQAHFNRGGLDFMLVAPIEFVLGSRRRLTQRSLELNDPARHKNDFWIPVAGVDFTDDIRQPFTIQLDVATTVSGTAGVQQGATGSQTRSTTQTRTTANTFSVQLNGEVSQGGSASASIEILELGLEQMFKLGGSMGFSRTVTNTASTTVAREFSRSLSYSRTYATSQAQSTRTSLTVSPPEVPPPQGTGRGGRPSGARAVGVGSVGVYLYPLVAFFEVPFVRFEGVNRFGQATRRTAGTVAVPYITEWRLTSHRGG